MKNTLLPQKYTFGKLDCFPINKINFLILSMFSQFIYVLKKDKERSKPCNKNPKEMQCFRKHIGSYFAP